MLVTVMGAMEAQQLSAAICRRAGGTGRYGPAPARSASAAADVTAAGLGATGRGIRHQETGRYHQVAGGLGQEDLRGPRFLVALAEAEAEAEAEEQEEAAGTGLLEAEQEAALERVAAAGRQPLVAARAIKGVLLYHGIIEYEY